MGCGQTPAPTPLGCFLLQTRSLSVLKARGLDSAVDFLKQSDETSLLEGVSSEVSSRHVPEARDPVSA